MDKLDKLLFIQGGKCFFCDGELPRNIASVEHLLPKSLKGNNSDDNCVACCKSINQLLGSMTLKEKLRVLLNQKGEIKCPRVKTGSSEQITELLPTEQEVNEKLNEK